jgi:repressor LexA
MLTKRQKELLDYLAEYIEQNGYAPTLEEIGRNFSLGSLATVHKHLQNLERKGHIRRLANRSRALEIMPRDGSHATVQVPLLGRVAAGTPIEPVENAESVELPEELLGRGETFALRVQGDSMKNDGILDGDVVVIESRNAVENGATVVALVHGEATLKRFFRAGNRVRLEPANERIDPILAAAEDVQVRGEVVALLRRYR